MAPEHLHSVVFWECEGCLPRACSTSAAEQPAAPQLSFSEVRRSRQRIIGKRSPHPQLLCSSDPLPLHRRVCEDKHRGNLWPSFGDFFRAWHWLGLFSHFWWCGIQPILYGAQLGQPVLLLPMGRTVCGEKWQRRNSLCGPSPGRGGIWSFSLLPVLIGNVFFYQSFFNLA